MAKLKYNKGFPVLAEGCARDGMIDTEIAKILGITISTFYNYQLKYPEFLEAIKKGKMPVDTEVENALLKRVRGFEYEETMVEYKPAPEGATAEPKTIKKTKKFIVPDTAACIFWLKNRKPQKWRDKQDLEHSGEIKAKIERVITDERPED